MRSDVVRVIPELIDALREDLARADYTVDGVTAMLGPVAGAALQREEAVPAQRVTAQAGTAVATLVRLFSLGDPVDDADIEAALPSLGIAGATRLGLVERQGGAMVATCDLRPYAADDRSWWVASDLGELATGRPVAQDHVLGIGGASATLASWTPRSPVDRALDVGTGGGVQALHLCEHASHVVVTDLSERALAFAAFNAALSGLSWDIRQGSMLEPVAGERFDLIVSNPPFVITPRSGAVPLFEYRDGGASGDDVVAGLVRAVADHLQPGGVAQVLGNWEIPAGRDWRDRVRGWLTGTGLDAWVVQREVQDPAQYAETWARDGGHHSGTSEYAAMYAAWLDDFATRGVGAIGFGVITLHRPRTDRPVFVDLVEVTGPVAAPMGPVIAAGLAAREWLATHGDDELLDTPWRCAPDVTIETFQRPGVRDPDLIRARQGGGLGLAVALDTFGAAYVSVADGSLTPRQACAAIAGLLDTATDLVQASVLPLLRDLVKDGFVLAP